MQIYIYIYIYNIVSSDLLQHLVQRAAAWEPIQAERRAPLGHRRDRRRDTMDVHLALVNMI